MFGKGGMGNLMKQAQQMQDRMQKLQEEIQLNYVDIFISSKTLNFLTPPVILGKNFYFKENINLF